MRKSLLILIFVMSLLLSSCDRSVTLTAVDAVTGERIEGVTLSFYPSSCYSTDIYIVGYDYDTCDGKYDVMPNATTDAEGQVTYDLNGNFAWNIRYVVVPDERYAPNPSYALTGDYTIELIPTDSALGTKEKAIEFVESLPEFIELREVSAAEGFVLTANTHEHAYYGIWRVPYTKVKDNRVYDYVYVCVDPATQDYRIYPGRSTEDDGEALRGDQCEQFDAR